MESYEHKIETFSEPMKDANRLNKMSEEGWHLVGVLTEEYTTYPGGGGMGMPPRKNWRYIYYFVRVKEAMATAGT